jgi:hypothetical protein
MEDISEAEQRVERRLAAIRHPIAVSSQMFAILRVSSRTASLQAACAEHFHLSA